MEPRRTPKCCGRVLTMSQDQGLPVIRPSGWWATTACHSRARGGEGAAGWSYIHAHGSRDSSQCS
jgi:hypothetical protein